MFGPYVLCNIIPLFQERSTMQLWMICRQTDTRFNNYNRKAAIIRPTLLEYFNHRTVESSLDISLAKKAHDT